MSVAEKDFDAFESKIDEVVRILDLMNSTENETQDNAIQMAHRFLGEGPAHHTKLTEDDFIVKIKENRTVINKLATSSTNNDASKDTSIFMQEVERDAARRAKERKERESVAQNLRRLGNDAFRKGEYEKAISMYSKAIDHVKDSSVLYNNRALSYIKLGLPKKAIIDVDFVIQKLDEKNVRSWLYRANGYYLLGEMRDFEKSVNEAKKNNPKELEFIEKAVAQILAANTAEETIVSN